LTGFKAFIGKLEFIEIIGIIVVTTIVILGGSSSAGEKDLDS